MVGAEEEAEGGGDSLSKVGSTSIELVVSLVIFQFYECW